MDVLYAPYDRLSPAASHVWADWVFGGILLLVVAWAVVLAWTAWVHSVALRKEVWQARGLRPGVLLLAGVAEPVEHELVESKNDALFPPFVELKIQQRGVQRRNKNSHYVEWKETSRSLSERPFHLRTDSGTLVRVEPSGRVELLDRLEPPVRTGHERLRIARIVPGERIWVRGQLAQRSAGGGPYRGDGATGAALHTLRPAPSRPLFISSEPVEQEERATARFHGLYALALLGAMMLSQLAIFRTYQALRSHGVDGTARVDDFKEWVVRNKNSRTFHYAFDLTYVCDGLRYEKREEVNRGAYLHTQELGTGTKVPIVYDARSPDRVEIGNMREVGLPQDNMVFALVLTAGLVIAWITMSSSRRPWWRRSTLDETQPGML